MPGDRDRDAGKSRSSWDERWSDLALDGTLQVQARATITERAFAALRKGDTAIAPSPASSAPHAPEPGTLPRISLAPPGSGSHENPTGPAGSLPDLVLGELLGEGGMGRVYSARQRSLGREVAVKTVKPQADQHYRDALVHESVLTGFLQHPGILPVHALGVDDQQQPVLVMKRIEGVSWAELLDDADHPGWEAWDQRIDDRLQTHLEILSQVCDAADFAHSHGIVHRDIKPQNVMLGKHGEVYLVDWGVATRVGTAPPDGSIVGTPAYMASEMAAGDPVDARTDVYLLGATLHQVLTGTTRHTGKNLGELLVSAFNSMGVKYDDAVPAELARLGNEATHVDPARRPASANELRRRISDFHQHRASVSLSDAASSSLRELTGLLDRVAREDVETEAGIETVWRARAQSLAAEARFGFEQAISAWQGNDGALKGLGASQAAAVRMELMQRDAPGARALLDAMSSPPVALVQQVAALEQEVAAEQAEKLRLEKMAGEMDARVSMTSRLGGLVAMVLVTFAYGAYLRMQEGGLGAVHHGHLIVFAALLLVGGGASVYVGRKKLMVNAFNRRAVATLFLMFAGLLLNRVTGWALQRPVADTLTGDLLLTALVAGAGAITLLRWLAWLGLVLAAGIPLILLFPEHAMTIFAGAVLVSLLLGMLFWRRTD